MGAVVKAGFTTALLAALAFAGVVVGGVAALAEEPVAREEKLEYDAASGRWVEEQPPVPGTPEGDLRLARQDFAAGHHRAACRRLKAWVKTYGESHERYPHATLLWAEVEIARRDYYKAHSRLQEFLGEHAGTTYAERAAELEFVIAEVFLGGTKRKWLGMRILGAEDLGISILDDLSTGYPESPLAEAAVKTKGDYYYRKGDFALAEIEYATLGQDFPQSRYGRYAVRRSADAALASFPGIEFDDAALIEAEERYHDYVTLYPGSAEQEGIGLILEDIASQRAAKEFETGRYYERTKHQRAAAFYYRSTITNWPNTIAAVRARDRLDALGYVEETPDVAEAPDTLEATEIPADRAEATP